VIKESTTGGLGVFVCRDIEYDELLLVVYPIPILFDSNGVCDEICNVLDGRELQQAELSEVMERLHVFAYEREMEIQKAFSRAAVRYLANERV
jgi:hypothetical protein